MPRITNLTAYIRGTFFIIILLLEPHVAGIYKSFAERPGYGARMRALLAWLTLVLMAAAATNSVLHPSHWLREASDDTAIGLGIGLFLAEKMNGLKQ